MKTTPRPLSRLLPLAFASGLMLADAAFAADAPQLAATIKRVESMVEHGAMSRDKADAMIMEARRKAAATEAGATGAADPAGVAPVAMAETATAARSEMRDEIKRELLAELKGQMTDEIKSQMAADIKRQMTDEIKSQMVADIKRQMTDEIKRQVLAELTGPAAASAAGAEPADGQAPPKSRVVRVPYVPEVVRRELHDQIKEEVLTQAKAERWGDPGAMPDWLSRIKWDGDLRVRLQSDRPAKGNAPASDYVLANQTALTTRAPDLGLYKGYADLANTQADRNRMRLQFRLGVDAKISEDFSGGARITTGNTSDRVSTNQTLGQNFNKYMLVLDRAFLKYEPRDWLSVSGGRIPNPWFSTDLVWYENLNFEGVAASIGRRSMAEPFRPFVTAGMFPIREDNPPTRNNRWLDGLQTGFAWDINGQTRVKLGAAYYRYQNLEGRAEPDSAFNCSSGTCVQRSSSYGQYEYEAGLRQKGNTLFVTNAKTDPNYNSAPIWGLASRFREVDLTASIDLAHWDPIHVVLIGDYVKNVGYDKNEIFSRTGLASADIPDGKNIGRMLKLQVGWPEVKLPGEWNAFAAYRYLGSDAVLDAFTDSDFGLGGTNMKGYQIGLKYGLDRNVSLGLRWMSADSIDSMIPSSPTLGLSSKTTKFAVDLLQVDVSARF